MKVLFVQQQLFPYFGILSLSGYLRARGCDTHVLIDAEHSERSLRRLVAEIAPDLIGFSLMSTEHAWFEKRSAMLKEHFPTIPIIAGGIHAVLYPDDLAVLPSVDYVCAGEGEATVHQLLLHLAAAAPLENVGGLVYRKDGGLVRTPMNALAALDDFPEDRRIYYDRYPVLRNLPLKVFVSSRGCPHRCSFCVNAQLQQTYRGLGPYVRRKSVEHFIGEMADSKRQFGMRSVFIADDLFVSDKRWLARFAEAYPARIGLPFICTCRADMLDEDVAGLLVAAGCTSVTFGVETGNEQLRRTVLRKNISDGQLLAAARTLTGAGIRYQTSNMFCLPGETEEDAVRTIDLNIRMGTSFSMSAIFLPFPKTELADLCIAQGYLKPGYSFRDMPHSFITRSVLALEDRKVIERIQKVAGLIIQYPAARGVLLFLARWVKIYSVHFLLYLVGTVLRFRAERRMSLLDTVRYIWSYRKSA